MNSPYTAVIGALLASFDNAREHAFELSEVTLPSCMYRVVVAEAKDICVFASMGTFTVPFRLDGVTILDACDGT